MWQLHASKRLIMRDKSLEEDMGSFICRELLGNAKKAIKESKREVPFRLKGFVGITKKGYPVPPNSFIIWNLEVDGEKYLMYTVDEKINDET